MGICGKEGWLAGSLRDKIIGKWADVSGLFIYNCVNSSMF